MIIIVDWFEPMAKYFWDNKTEIISNSEYFYDNFPNEMPQDIVCELDRETLSLLRDNIIDILEEINDDNYGLFRRTLCNLLSNGIVLDIT